MKLKLLYESNLLESAKTIDDLGDYLISIDEESEEHIEIHIYHKAVDEYWG